MKFFRLDPRHNRYYGIFESGTLKMMGLVEVLFAFMLLIPAVFAVYYGEDTLPFTTLVPFLLVLGFIQMFIFRQSQSFRSANGLLVVAAAWAFVFFIGMVPYVIAGMGPFDAVFESVSGFTTTGATIMSDIESWPKSILIWRALTQWVGGITVIIIFMYILPFLGIGRQVMANELSGSGGNRYSVKMQKAAKSFIFVFMLLSLSHLLILMACGVPSFEAVCLMFTTISTGGFMCTNNSLTDFSDLVQVITIVFMFMGGVNFYLHYRFIYHKDPRRHDIDMSSSRSEHYIEDESADVISNIHDRVMVYLGNSEFRFNLFWFLAMSLLATVVILYSVGFQGDVVDAFTHTFKNVLFTVVSLGTTTGYFVVDYMTWPQFVIVILFLVAFFGASAGSTSGGIKLYRLRIAYGFLVNAVGRTLRPNGIYTVKTDRNTIDDTIVLSALSVIMMYIVTLVLASFVIMLYGYEILDAFGLGVSVVSNGGLGFGQFGPSGSMATLPDSLKLILSFLMWVGRLEILIALAFLTPAFWREIWHNRRMKSRLKRENKSNLVAERALDKDQGHTAQARFSVLRRRR